MNKRTLWKVLLGVLVIGILAGGGYALNRVGYAQGYTVGLAENVGEDGLAAFFEQRFDSESWFYGPNRRFDPSGMMPFPHSGVDGWGFDVADGAFPFAYHSFGGRGFAPGMASPLRCIAPLIFWGGFITLVVWLIRRKRGHPPGGNGWQLSFGPRPPMDNIPPEE